MNKLRGGFEIVHGDYSIRFTKKTAGQKLMEAIKQRSACLDKIIVDDEFPLTPEDVDNLLLKIKEGFRSGKLLDHYSDVMVYSQKWEQLYRDLFKKDSPYKITAEDIKPRRLPAA